MGFGLFSFIFRGKTFCCCFPVRLGVIVITFLSIILAGTTSIIIWYEVASTPDLTSGERASFIVAGLFESLLVVGSILGFAGAVARKQLFVAIYAFFTYFHVALNTVIGIIFLVMVNGTVQKDSARACQLIKDKDTHAQCDGLLKIAKGAYFALALLVILAEIYGAIIVARYLHQLKTEKRTLRASRIAGSESGISLIPNRGRYTAIDTDHSAAQFPSKNEFNPYEEQGSRHDPHTNAPPYGGIPLEEGYGGGRWSLQDVVADEKKRLRELEGDENLREYDTRPLSTHSPIDVGLAGRTFS